jgi:uncharacterized protein YeaO (DUF488 family)
MKGTLRIKRVYEPVAKTDGQRILVDRVWPRGMTREKAALTLWLKDVAPSADLRKWFGHDPARFAAFRDRYRDELAANGEAVEVLCSHLDKGDVTLLYGARDTRHNQAVVLAEYLAGRGYRFDRDD